MVHMGLKSSTSHYTLFSYQCYKVHGNFHVPFWYRIFELVSMVRATCTTWKFPCTLLNKNFLINLNVTGYMEISMDPFGIEFLN